MAQTESPSSQDFNATLCRPNKKPIPPFRDRHRRFDCVKVADTPNCGLGVFALQTIKGGVAVGQALGEVKPSGFRSNYCIEFGNGVMEPLPPYRFLNHSCMPNCQLIEWEIENELADSESSDPVIELWVHALRDIAINEELTIDYGWDWRSAIPCKCGASNCRGWICNEEDLDVCRKFHANDKG